MRGVRYLSMAEHSGYGLAAQSYLLALIDAGVNLEWFPLVPFPHGYAPWTEIEGSLDWVAGLAGVDGAAGFFGPALLETIGAGIDHDVVVQHSTPEHWPRYLDPDHRNIGYTVWETDAPPPHWPDLANLMDRVLVPSRFNRSVFRAAGITTPIDVVPHIRRPATAPPTRDAVEAFRRGHRIPRHHLVFYTIEAWTARKTPWKTILAFLEAFSSPDPVSLVVKTGPEGPRSGADAADTPTRVLVHDLISSFRDPAHVVLIDRQIPAATVDLLHHVGDVYLSLTHSEGWGLSGFDAIAVGNPVITTGWGGQLEYLGGDWPYLIDFRLTPVMDAKGRGSYLPSQRWATPVMGHAVSLLREVFERPEVARKHAAELSERVRTEFSEEAVGRLLIEAIGRGA